MDDAFFAMYQYGSGPDESFAKANKEGLELLAAKLLKASRDFDEIVNNDDKDVFLLDFDEDWIDGDIIIDYVEPVDKNKKEIREVESHQTAFSDRLISFGFLGVIILIVISAFVGLISIFKWIFWFLYDS